MPWSELLTAVGLMLVIEGIVPFASPRAYRRGVSRMAALTPWGLRGLGLIVMVAGAALVRLAGANG